MTSISNDDIKNIFETNTIISKLFIDINTIKSMDIKVLSSHVKLALARVPNLKCLLILIYWLVLTDMMDYSLKINSKLSNIRTGFLFNILYIHFHLFFKFHSLDETIENKVKEKFNLLTQTEAEIILQNFIMEYTKILYKKVKS